MKLCDSRCPVSDARCERHAAHHGKCIASDLVNGSVQEFRWEYGEGRLPDVCAFPGCSRSEHVQVCCSSHAKKLCHRHYRLTHFVEVCDCALCVRRGEVELSGPDLRERAQGE